MNAVFTIDGLPELNARLDKIAVVVANPTTREALVAGGKVIKDKAEELCAPAHKGFAQQLQAVARAERTGQIDPRLTRFWRLRRTWPDIAGLGQ
jgi:ureidoglycolate hydrolase